MTTKSAAERVAALRDEYARLGENVDHLSDLDLLNCYAELRERECTNTRDRYMALLVEQRKYGDRVRAAAGRELLNRIDRIAVDAVQRRAQELDQIFAAVIDLPERANAERVQQLKNLVAKTRHMLALYDGVRDGINPRREWRLDDYEGMVKAARSVVGVLRDKPGVAAEDVIRLVGEALSPNGNLRDLFKVAGDPIVRQQPVFAGNGWAEMGGGSYYTFEPAGSAFRVLAYPVDDAWWLDLQGPTGALIAAGEVGEGDVQSLAASLVEQAPELAKSGLRPWQCWQNATTTSAAMAA